MSIVHMTWQSKMAFDASVSGHHIQIDAAEQSGGENSGPGPKKLLLVALAGCTGMDVVSILKKMKVADYKFEMDVDADSTSDHPIVYSKIYLDYRFDGKELPTDKIKKAVDLSQDRYCGVSAMLRKAAPIITRIFINEKEIR